MINKGIDKIIQEDKQIKGDGFNKGKCLKKYKRIIENMLEEHQKKE